MQLDAKASKRKGGSRAMNREPNKKEEQEAMKSLVGLAYIASLTKGIQVFSHAALIPVPHPSRRFDEMDAGIGSDSAIDATIADARGLCVEDVTIAGTEFLRRAVNASSAGPIGTSLSAAGFGGRFREVRITRFARTATLSSTRAPLGPFEALTKRWFDVTASAVALALVSPLFAAVALLIKFDSRGPVFFRQRRRGYNTEEFRIWKFRTMTTLDDGDVVVQATESDRRITVVGSFLRRTSLDELPQLINVIKGEMSLVGPRPHAVAHDVFFERRIDLYPRRLHVKPGITDGRRSTVSAARPPAMRRCGNVSITISITSTIGRSALISTSSC